MTADPSALRARLRRLATTLTAILVLLDFVSIALLVSGSYTTIRLGVRRLHVQDVFGAAEVGAGLCGILGLLGWHSPAVRRAAFSALAVMALLALFHAASSPPIWPAGDGALIHTYTLLAAQGKLMVGPYSRFGWHHPGPLYFWIAAPFCALDGYRSTGLEVAVLTINMTSVVIIAWVTARFASDSLKLALFILTATYVYRIRDIVLSGWNPYVPIMAAAALGVVAAAVLAGHLRLLPLAVGLASFVAQTHVGMLPYSAGAVALALVGAVVGRFAGGHRKLDRRTARILSLTMWLLAALWIGPIAQQLTHSPGNLAQLWRFFMVDQHVRPPLRDAFVAWADNITSLLRPGFHLPGGGPFVPDAARWPLAWAVLHMVLLFAATLWFKVKGRRFDASFSCVALFGSIVALWSLTRIVEDIPEYAIFWISAVGMLGLAAIAAAAADLLGMRRAQPVRLPGWAARALSVGLVAICGGIVWQQFDAGMSRLSQGNQGPEERQVQALFDGVQRYLIQSRAHRPLLRMDVDTWAVAAGLGFQLQRAGVDYAVEKSAVPLFSDAFAPNGDEDVDIFIADSSAHRQLVTRPGSVTVASYYNYVYADAIPVRPIAPR